MALAVLLATQWSATAAADESAAPPTGVDLRAVPPILDPAYRHRKVMQLELDLFGGTYLGASLKKSWISGARAYLHLTRDIALGLGYGFSRHAVNQFAGPGTQLHQRNTHYLSAEGALSTDVAMRFGRSTLIEMDLFMTLGGGLRQLDGDWGPLGLVGGGVKVYTGLSWLAVRVDVNNYLHGIPKPGGTVVEMDVSFSGAVVFLFPPDASPYED